MTSLKRFAGHTPLKTVNLLITLLILLGTSACSAVFSGGKSTLNITFSNQTQFEVCEIYISTENANDWGENKLAESETLAAGAEKSFSVKRGKYDLLVRSCAEETLYSYHGASNDFTVVLGGQGNLPIRAVNGAKVETCFVYIAPFGGSDWGEDRLGGVESILPGAIRIFFVEPGSYNLRAEDCSKNILSEVENFDPSGGLDWSIRP